MAPLSEYELVFLTGSDRSPRSPNVCLSVRWQVA